MSCGMTGHRLTPACQEAADGPVEAASAEVLARCLCMETGANLPVSIDSENPGRGGTGHCHERDRLFTRVDRSEGASGGTSAVHH